MHPDWRIAAKAIASIIGVAAFAFQTTARQLPADLTKILESHGLRGGLAVHIGCGDGSLVSDFYGEGNFLVQGLDNDSEVVAGARREIIRAGDYGRISVNRYDGQQLPYTDYLVNLAVVNEGDDLSVTEVVRVLSPYGILAFRKGTFGELPFSMDLLPEKDGWIMAVRQYPAKMDEWRQYLHGADNNAVARDSVVGPPRYLQWTSNPVWSRSHMAIPTITGMVSSRGRLFSIEDHALPENPFLPGQFYIVARNAFNGLKLWERRIPEWESVTRYIKGMTTQLQRRMVAVDNTLYCTPGLSAPITAFDASSGEVHKVYSGTGRSQEFAYHRGVLYAVIGDRMNAAGKETYDTVKLSGNKGTGLGGSDPNASFDGCGFDVAYSPEIPNISNPASLITAVDAKSGKELWRKDEIIGYTGCSLALKGSRLVYQVKDKGLFCLDAQSGTEIWYSAGSFSKNNTGVHPNTVVISDKMVYASAGKSLEAFSLVDGSHQWSAPIAKNYHKPADILITGGALWVGGRGIPTSYDLRTGARLSRIDQKKTGPMGHERCYRNFITERYFINSKTGGADFLELETGREFPNYWIRGTCGYGVLPCNGLLYSTPFSCSCSIGAMIQNTNAVYTEPGLGSSDDPIPVEIKNELTTGSAYNYVDSGYAATGWPTFRHDGGRSGATEDSVPASGLSEKWEFQLPGDRPSALTIEDGKVFVSDIDRHTIYALSVASGTKIWAYTAGARVDSPPTFYKGLLLFGGRDGIVYCLKADTGEISWRFRGLPDRLICAFNRLESPWPVNGGVVVENGVVYLSAGRSSFLDGGIFHYGLDARTGKVKYSRHIYGPFDAEGFPATHNAGYKNDIFVSDGARLYVRHKAFKLDLSDASPAEHIIPTAGFLDRSPQHRTYWGYGARYSKRGNRWGELLVHDGHDSYQIRGFPVNRHSYFDPRVTGYELSQQKNGWKKSIPIGTKTLLLAGDNLFVGGFPLGKALGYDRSDRREEAAAYTDSYEGRRGSIMRAVSKTDGRTLADYTIDTEVSLVWDTMAAAGGELFFCLADGRVVCFSSRD